MAVPPDVEALLRRAYAAFNARDVDAAVAILHPDVDWPNAFEGGRVRGRDSVRAYWVRQFDAIDPQLMPRVVADGAIVDLDVLRDALVERMDVEPAS